MYDERTTLQKPPRTFGISLAIVLSVFLFSVIPFLQIAVLGLIQYRTSGIGLIDGGTDTPIAVGASFGGVSNEFLIVQALFGAVFLVIAFFAWRGRPSSIRAILIVSVLLLTGFYVWDSVTAIFTPPDPQDGLDAGGPIRTVLHLLRLAGNLLVPLYVLWYLNRAPARAFFRGAYLPEAEISTQEE